MLQILFAFLAGILTVAAPCILPMLPILLGASVGQANRKRPLLIVFGFILSFAAASLLLSLLVTHLGLSANAIRDGAIVLLLIFAVLLIWPKPFELLTMKLSGTINRAGQVGKGQGAWGGFVLGLVLGIVWTPCAGPVLGSILTVIATQGTTARASVLVLAYAIGAGVPMLVLAYGSQWLTTRIRSVAKYSVRLQQLFGVLILLLAVAMYFQYDTKIENALTAYFPQSSLEQKLTGQSNTAGVPSGGSVIQFSNYGQAPDFVGISNWLNSNPLTVQQLRGKVVLVDFWTYSCINCIRTLPYVTGWYNQYNSHGFVVIGVHTPEFAFEHDSDNVANAIKQFGIHYPVAQDNNYATWNAYKNEYWPAEYLINQQGQIVHEQFGEGDYNVTENDIRQLLGLNNDPNAKTSTLGNIESPEMYFEPSRLEYLSATQSSSPRPTGYSLPASLPLNTFALGGKWQFNSDHAESLQNGDQIKLQFDSGKVYMVAAASGTPVTLHITVDGKSQPDVTVSSSQLYTLFNSTDYSNHTLIITTANPGLEAFTFTFG